MSTIQPNPNHVLQSCATIPPCHSRLRPFKILQKLCTCTVGQLPGKALTSADDNQPTEFELKPCQTLLYPLLIFSPLRVHKWRTVLGPESKPYQKPQLIPSHTFMRLQAEGDDQRVPGEAHGEHQGVL